MSLNAGGYYPQASLIGTLVFPGRKSVLPASTVPEYPAQAYPVLNFSKPAYDMVVALGDDHIKNPLASLVNNSFSNFAPNPSFSGGYNVNNSYLNNNNASLINIMLNLIKNLKVNTGENAQNQPAKNSFNINNGLSFFDPKPISDFYGNQIPFNNAVVQDGFFGNVHGVTSILSRFVGDIMPTDKNAPGYTWKYTVPELIPAGVPGILKTDSAVASTTTTSTTTTTTTQSTTTTNTTASANKTSGTQANNPLALFNPKPISDFYGNQIPFNNAIVQDGLFGNVHGVTSILARYVGDIMPTDKNAPGYTWKYTVPAG